MSSIEEKNTLDNNLKHLRSLFNVYLRVYNEINKENRYRCDDVRASTFQKCMICFRNMYINISFSRDEKAIAYMLKDFIIEKGNYSMNMDSITYEYVNCSKVAMQLMIFSCIESSLRPIYKVLNLGEESDNFYNIYTSIIDEFNMNNDYRVVFSILSKIRNTLHNNGVYIDKCQKSHNIEYKGYTYKFNHNYAIKDVWISNLNDLYRGVVVFLKDLFNEEKIRNISFIGDRYATAEAEKNINNHEINLLYINK